MSYISWISPKINRGIKSKISGKGIVAQQPIAKNETIAIKGGKIINSAELYELRDIIRNSELQITDELYIAPTTVEEFEQSMIYVNHSCEPNASLAGTEISLVAMRDIGANEEVTVDYGTYLSRKEFEMKCTCSQPSCRKIITGNDWKNPSIREKYDGHFAWYLQKKVNNIKSAA